MMVVSRISRVFLRTAGFILALMAAGVVVAWNLGWIIGDVWTWSQWLSWIPALMLAPAGVLLIIGLSLAVGGRGWQIGLILMMAGPVIFLVQNWRPGTSWMPSPEGLTITHWTLGSVLSDEETYARTLLEAGSQLNIIEGGRKIRWTDTVKDWLGIHHASSSTGIFSVITKLPMEKLRHLIWADGIHVAKLELNGPGFETTPLRILLVDLPSDPHRGRWKIAEQLRNLLEQVDIGGFDLVIGDFNMPAQSRALRTLFPGYQSSWNQAGEGWAATYPRGWPIARLDHILEGPTVEVVGLRTLNPGIGRHSMQTMMIRPR